MKLRFKPTYLLISSLALLTLGVVLYRENAMQSIKQVASIVALDEQGKPVDAPISKLKLHTKAHMNAHIAFKLQGSYSRAYAAAQAAALQQTKAGAQVYSDAQANCSARVDSIQLSNCVTNYINTHAVPGQTEPPAIQIDKTKYTYSLQSPQWSWDLAGISIALGISLLFAYALVILLKPKRPKRF